MEQIKLAEYDNESFICICGNEPCSEGFYPCDSTGKYIEPCIDEGWIDLYRCDRCGRIINQNTLKVIGTYIE